MKYLASKKYLGHIVAACACALSGACSQNEAPDDGTSPAPAIVRMETAEQALEGVHVPTLDPQTMNDAEIRKLIGTGPHCIFRYTSTGKPVAVVGSNPGGRPASGGVKLNGVLVPLDADPGAASDIARGVVLLSNPVRLSIQPDPQSSASPKPNAGLVEAEMTFEVGQQLKVGYAGFLECGAAPAVVPAR